MYVRSRMTANPYTVATDATVAETLELMRKRNIRRVPVIKNYQLAGIITERQLLEVSPSPATSLSIFEINYLLAKTKVESIMTRDVITIGPSDLLEEAARKMREHDIGGLPVIDKGRLVGIITETDIFDAFIEILGFKDRGSRITIEIEDDKPGVLADITSMIAQNGLNITHVVVFMNELIIRVNTINIDNILDEIKKKGHKIISVLKNG